MVGPRTDRDVTGVSPDRDDRGVSPVIGVILMVSITVILAAVIGNFVLSTGSQVDTNIQAGANVEHHPAKNEIKVTWTSNQNAEKVTVKFKESGTTTKTLNSVGETFTYACNPGKDVQVIVVAEAGGVTSVIHDTEYVC